MNPTVSRNSSYMFHTSVPKLCHWFSSFCKRGAGLLDVFLCLDTGFGCAEWGLGRILRCEIMTETSSFCNNRSWLSIRRSCFYSRADEENLITKSWRTTQVGITAAHGWRKLLRCLLGQLSCLARSGSLPEQPQFRRSRHTAKGNSE